MTDNPTDMTIHRMIYTYDLVSDRIVVKHYARPTQNGQIVDFTFPMGIESATMRTSHDRQQWDHLLYSMKPRVDAGEIELMTMTQAMQRGVDI